MSLFTVRVIGAVEVSRRLSRDIPVAMRGNVSLAVRTLGVQLERKVKMEKLAGQVLNRRTGRAVRSVNLRYTETDTRFESSVGSALSYLRAWELGFRVPERIIKPRNKQALFWQGARHPVRWVHQKARYEAPRKWLRSALTDMRPQIKETLRAAIRGR